MNFYLTLCWYFFPQQLDPLFRGKPSWETAKRLAALTRRSHRNDL